MRRLAAAALAVPVVLLLYVPLLLRRSIAARVGIAIAVGALLGVGAIGILRPAATVATPPLPPIEALPVDAFTTAVTSATDLAMPVTITFSEPMDRESVAALLEVQPLTATTVRWSDDSTVMTVDPTTRWASGTYHTVSVPAGALSASGRPMSKPARAAFVTRPATSGGIEVTSTIGEFTAVGSGFRLTFDRPVDLGSVRDGLRISPPIEGVLDASRRTSDTFVFQPSVPLAPGMTYTVALVGVLDTTGSPIASPDVLTVGTTPAPSVVRFRPQHRTTGVDQAAGLSVRFSQPMDRASTTAAFSATIGGKAIAGRTTFAENDTVAIFDPAALLPYGAEVQLQVSTAALAKTGVPLAGASSVRFTVEAKPVPVVRTTSSGGGSSGGSSGGGAVGGGSWAAVETYYLGLMNCTRTGGWVTSSGGCSSPGGRSVAPLKLDAGISSKVARPYAKKLATSGACSHFIGGNPGDRLRAAGYTSYIWAENLGCRSGDPKAAVLGSHLFFQSEKSYLGGHYVNLMNAKYDRVGIGVWASGGRVRLVVDFYHPR